MSNYPNYEGGFQNQSGMGYPRPEQPPAAPKKAKSDKVATRRVVTTQKRLAIVFAGIAGLLAVMILSNTTPVVYVARTTDAVTNLVELSPEQWDVVAVDPEFVEDGAFTGKDAEELKALVAAAVKGKRVGIPLAKHQQLREALFIDTLTLTSPLEPDERLISISARAGNAIVGTIRPGDRIDVYASTDELAGFIGQDVEVVAVSMNPENLDSAAQSQLNERDKTLGQLVPGEPIPGTYVLRVRTADVPSYVAADIEGHIYLILRGKDAGETEPGATTLKEVLCLITPDSSTCRRGY